MPTKAAMDEALDKCIEQAKQTVGVDWGVDGTCCTCRMHKNSDGAWIVDSVEYDKPNLPVIPPSFYPRHIVNGLPVLCRTCGVRGQVEVHVKAEEVEDG